MRDRYKRGQDFRIVFRWARRELALANRINFATKGATSGRPWLPLDDEYARWKLSHAGPRPLMVFDGNLRRSLTNLRGAPNEIDKTDAWFGTNVPYAQYHQWGTRKMPSRKIVFVPPFFAQALGAQAAEWIVHGSISNGIPLLKRAI